MFKDERTGARVRQITDHEAISHPTYFLQTSFPADQRSIVFTSYRTGAAQLFEAGYPDGPVRQLTDGDAIHPFSPLLLSAGEAVLFVRGGEIWTLDRANLQETRIAAVDGQLGECSVSSDGQWFVAAAKTMDGWGLFIGTLDGRENHWIPYARTIIHPQFSPTEPEWIEFAGDPAPRMHRVRRDGSGLECLYEHDNDEFVVHETFLGETGDLLFTVWPKALKRMDWHTREIQTIAEINAWHITPNRDGTKVLCDTNHPDRGLLLIDVGTGEWRTLCHPGASSGGSQWKTSRYAVAADWAAARAATEKKESLSWMEMAVDTVYGPQWTHPHPSFSPDERLVAFASDRTGVTQVYVAELDSLPD